MEKTTGAKSGASEAENVDGTAGMSDMQKRLFNIRMKINQGRKANKTEVEEEYKRFNDPKYEQKKNVARKNEQAVEQVDGIGEQHEAPKWKEDKNAYLHQTAESAEFSAEKAQRKKDNMATFGWQAFTTDANYRSYEKKLGKLPTSKVDKTDSSLNVPTLLESNPLAYGTVGANVSQAAKDRVAQDVIDRQEANRRNSKRRMHIEAADVDYINDKNAHFNKKLTRAYDKYTVEIRQNLERGTAI
jgi:hypothetical protein